MSTEYDLILVALRAAAGVVVIDATGANVTLTKVGNFKYSQGNKCVNLTENKLFGIYPIYVDSFGVLHLSKEPITNTGLITPSILADMVYDNTKTPASSYAGMVGYIIDAVVV